MSAARTSTHTNSSKDVANTSVSFPLGVFIVSLLAFPVCYGLNLTHAMEDSRYVFLAGLIACTSIIPITYISVVRNSPSSKDVYFYVFTMFAFTSLVDLVLALTIAGHLDWMAFYCKEGEIYLTTAHGLWINYWDGSYHYVCYLALTAMMLRKGHSYESRWFRTIGLVWGGSILNSMIVLFAGSAIGLHAVHIKPSYLLNIPYAGFPLSFVAKVWREGRKADEKEEQAGKVVPAKHTKDQAVASSLSPASSRRSILLWFVDLPLLSLLFLTLSICIFRTLVVLQSRLPSAHFYSHSIETYLLDSTAYPLIQMLSYAYYYVPYLLWAMVALVSNSFSKRFYDVTLFMIGALLQGSFSYILSALYEGDAYRSKERTQQIRDEEVLMWFGVVNGVVLVMPIMMLVRTKLAWRKASNKRQQTNEKEQ